MSSDGMRIESYDFRHPSRVVVIPPREDRPTPAPVLVALHGQGMSAQRFLRVLRHLHLPGSFWVLPEGPYPFERRTPEGIEIGYGWYQYRGDQDDFRQHLERSEAFLLEVVEDLESRHPMDRSRTTLLGFSQGGYLAGYMAVRNPDRFPGLVIASARLKHEFLEEELKGNSLPATLFLHGEDDPATPWPLTEPGRESLRRGGGDVEEFLHDAGHRLPPESIEHLQDWLERKGLADGPGA